MIELHYPTHLLTPDVVAQMRGLLSESENAETVILTLHTIRKDQKRLRLLGRMEYRDACSLVSRGFRVIQVDEDAGV